MKYNSLNKNFINIYAFSVKINEMSLYAYKFTP